MKKQEPSDYNVRIIDNGGGTFSRGHVSRFRVNNGSGDHCGTWVKGNQAKMQRLLTKGELVKE